MTDFSQMPTMDAAPPPTDIDLIDCNLSLLVEDLRSGLWSRSSILERIDEILDERILAVKIKNPKGDSR